MQSRSNWTYKRISQSPRGTRTSPTANIGKTHAKPLCVIAVPRSGAVCAAFEESSVAVTTSRFYWPARSREGVGSMGRDSPVERNGPGNASPRDARRAAPRESGGRSPRRVLGTFPRRKVPRQRQTSLPPRYAFAEQTRCGGCGPMKASAPTAPPASRLYRRGAHRASAGWRCENGCGVRTDKSLP